MELAWAYEREGRLKDAAEELAAAERNGADREECRWNAARIMCDQGEYEKALLQLKGLASDGADSARVRCKMGEVYFKTGRYDEALEQYTCAAELEPGDSRTYACLGMVYEKKGDLNRSAAEYARSVEKGNVSENAYSELARIYCRMDRHEKALKVIDKGLAVVHESPLLYAMRCMIYKDTGKYDEYKKELENLREKGLMDALLGIEGSVMPAGGGRFREDGVPALVRAPGFRGEIEPQQVIFTWQISYDCNYRCDYCSYTDEGFRRGLPEKTVLSPGQWEKAWEKIRDRYGSCHINITGGEPSVYPDFFAMLERVVKMHTAGLQTNLSWDVGEFTGRISPARVNICASFHPGKTDIDVFIRKILVLKEYGVEIGVNYVAHPLQMGDMGKYGGIFRKNGVVMTVQPFIGSYGGKKYPEGYTEAERVYLNEMGTDIPLRRGNLDWGLGIGKEEKPRERLCRMGQMYAVISPDGSMARCCANKTDMGNIIAGTAVLNDEALPCDVEKCPCFKSMIAGEEDRWALYWVIPPAARMLKLSRES